MKPDESTIWRRRAILMLIVGLAVAIPVTVVVRGEDEEASPTESASSTDSEPSPPALGPVQSQAGIGALIRVPEGWERERTGDVIELTARKRSARVAISSPGPAADADQLHAEVLRGLRASYPGFDVKKRIAKAPIGGLKGRATVVSARGKGKDSDLNIIVTTLRGKKRAYLVVVFTRAEGAGPEVLEAQSLVNNLRFNG